MGASRPEPPPRDFAAQTTETGASRGVLWLARVCVVVVLSVNVQCALAFVASPASYVANFQLAGVSGATMVRSLGLLFLMWNVPYAVAAWHPLRHRTSLIEATAMQAIGLVGETTMLSALPDAGYETLRTTGERFVRFDAAGLLLLFLAWGCVLVMHRARRTTSQQTP